MKTILALCIVSSMASVPSNGQSAVDPTAFTSWEPNEVPAGCPFGRSKVIERLVFTGRYANYTKADTWYPSWASDGNLYSPWTDGSIGKDQTWSGGLTKEKSAIARTGQAKIVGDDPLKLQIISLGNHLGSALPYGGRYPCGSLVYNGIWYHGSYALGWVDGPWDVMGPFVGFRISKDYGKTWIQPHKDVSNPLFGEHVPVQNTGPKVKFGAPHFVDFGKNMEHSPDGKAYLVGHGATRPEANNSWIAGDQIYMCRVTPGVDNMNDRSKYEFYGGRDGSGNPVWTHNFAEVKPLIEWIDNCGCVTMTYNAPLKKYIMCITYGYLNGGSVFSGNDGLNDVDYDTYFLESSAITGPWKMIHYLKAFGPQAYFVNIPSKFISGDGKTMWLCYSANWSRKKHPGNPLGSSYHLNLREFKVAE